MKKKIIIDKEELKNLFEAFSLINDYKEFEDFLYDICTINEIKNLCERLKVAKILKNENLSYRDISEKTGASLVTITRVSKFLNQEKFGGYKKILKKIQK